jgi:hypothetical protein
MLIWTFRGVLLWLRVAMVPNVADDTLVVGPLKITLFRALNASPRNETT